MNINTFKQGDIITRNAPVCYVVGERGDSSYCGERMELLGHDPEAKIIFVRESRFSHIVDLSYARDGWDEGWCYYPETMFQKALKLIKIDKAS